MPPVPRGQALRNVVYNQLQAGVQRQVNRAADHVIGISTAGLTGAAAAIYNSASRTVEFTPPRKKAASTAVSPFKRVRGYQQTAASGRAFVLPLLVSRWRRNTRRRGTPRGGYRRRR